MAVDQAFHVEAARTWISLPQHVTFAPSMSVFRGHLKAFFFRRSFPWLFGLYHNFCSACTVTVVIFGHLNSSFYLLTYLRTYLLTYLVLWLLVNSYCIMVSCIVQGLHSRWSIANLSGNLLILSFGKIYNAVITVVNGSNCVEQSCHVLSHQNILTIRSQQLQYCCLQQADMQHINSIYCSGQSPSWRTATVNLIKYCTEPGQFWGQLLCTAID